MPTLLLRLAGPLQSWGMESKFEVRRTMNFPSKSGVVGMLAAALGRSREEDISDLNALKFGVRVDREGQLLQDYHIARGKKEKDIYPTRRYYLSDAIFLVGLSCTDRTYLQELEQALENPAFPLFLGRRSCPPTMPLVMGIRDEDLLDALRGEPWLLEEWRQRRIHDDTQRTLRLIMDAEDGQGVTVMRDVPVSFSPIQRMYGWRFVQEQKPVLVEEMQNTEHDPMQELR